MSQNIAQLAHATPRASWWPLLPLCLGAFMVAINATVVSVALPSIRLALALSDISLIWIVDAYLVTSGGFLLLAGRLGDLYGRRRLLLIGTALFTVASLGCGVADSLAALIISRALQGLAGAIVSATGLSQIVNLFTNPSQRGQALGFYVFVNAGGGSIGLLIGGGLADALSWHWIFLVNVPLGLVICALCPLLIPTDRGALMRGRLDLAGALTATAAFMLAIFAITKAHHIGWDSVQTIASLAGAGLLMLIFIAIEARAPTPLMPLQLFRIRSLSVVCIVGALVVAAVLAWRFSSSLYLQLVLGLTPFQIGLAFLPADLTIAVMSIAVAPALVARIGVKWPLVIGLLTLSVGLAMLARLPVHASLTQDVLPGMFVLGLGAGMAYNPMFLNALSGVAPNDSGSASGVVNTSYTMGGALGLSVLASIAGTRTDALIAAGVDLQSALTQGHRLAFWLCALLALVATVISATYLRGAQRAKHPLCMAD